MDRKHLTAPIHPANNDSLQSRPGVFHEMHFRMYSTTSVKKSLPVDRRAYYFPTVVNSNSGDLELTIGLLGLLDGKVDDRFAYSHKIIVSFRVLS
jgi:hypothetical protein